MTSNRSAAPMASMAFRRRFKHGQVQSQFGSHKSSTEYLALRGASSGATAGVGASRTVGSSGRGAAGSVGALRPPAGASWPGDHFCWRCSAPRGACGPLRQRGVSPFVADREFRQGIVVVVVEAGPLGVVRAAAAGHFVTTSCCGPSPRATRRRWRAPGCAWAALRQPSRQWAAIRPQKRQRRKKSIASVLQDASFSRKSGKALGRGLRGPLRRIGRCRGGPLLCLSARCANQIPRRLPSYREQRP